MASDSKLQPASQGDEIKDRFTTWWNGEETDLPPSRESDVDAAPAEAGNADATIIHEPDGYVLLRQRLMAWWSGVDSQSREDDDPSLRIEKLTESPSTDPEWSEERLKLSKALWGVGFILPNTEVFAEHLISNLRLDSRKTILDISPGLGATALMMAEQKNVWIEAIGYDATLVEKAKQLLGMERFGHHIDLRHEEFDTVELPPLRYHIIYGREQLYAFAAKDHIVRQLCRSLKDHGKLLMFDYVMKEGSNDCPTIEAWRELEPGRVHPWTVGEYQSAFEKGGVALRGRDDFTEVMIQEIKTAWQRMLQSLKTGQVKPEHVDNIMHEGKLWESRLRAMQSGDLKLLRLDARKTLKDIALDGDDD